MNIEGLEGKGRAYGRRLELRTREGDYREKAMRGNNPRMYTSIFVLIP